MYVFLRGFANQTKWLNIIAPNLLSVAPLKHNGNGLEDLACFVGAERSYLAQNSALDF